MINSVGISTEVGDGTSEVNYSALVNIFHRRKQENHRYFKQLNQNTTKIIFLDIFKDDQAKVVAPLNRYGAM